MTKSAVSIDGRHYSQGRLYQMDQDLRLLAREDGVSVDAKLENFRQEFDKMFDHAIEELESLGFKPFIIMADKIIESKRDVLKERRHYMRSDKDL